MPSFCWLSLLPLLLLAGDLTGSSGEEKAEEAIGALGESVTFQLKFSQTFTTITLLRTNDLANIAALTPANKCVALILNPKFQGRLNVSEDCKSLQLKNLHQDDSGRYQAQIQVPDEKDLLILFFNLHVYKRLSEDDLSIHCNRIENGTWQVNCSAGEWEKSVEFGMEIPSNQREVSGRSLDIRQDLGKTNLDITCTATNPVSHASRIETLEDICTERPETGSTTEPDLEDEKDPPLTLGAIIAIVLGVLILAGAFVAFWFFRKKRKGDSRQPQGSADSGRCNTIYAQLGDVVEDRDSRQSHPRTQPAKEKPKTAQTIYITVDHASKPNPLQTDDEKMQKGRRRAAEPKEKTIYSEISTKPQEEDEDQSLKTVYETVNNPKPPV